MAWQRAGSGIGALGGATARAAGLLTISGPAGSVAFGTLVTNLPNGNIVVTDPLYTTGGVSACGAVYLYDTNLTLLGTLTGSSANDKVGFGGITVLANGNFLVHSPNWRTNCGAVTWVRTNGLLADGLAGGVVSADNSLVGRKTGSVSTGDMIGWNSNRKNVTVLTNGHYVVASIRWDNGSTLNAGAVTWGDGWHGVTGEVSAVNSLVGTNDSDGVGGTIATLANGHYVVGSPAWKNGSLSSAGAVTWCSGTTGLVGAVSTANSLVGTNASDAVGTTVTPLANGSYVVASPSWKNGSLASAGAVTWCNGTTGMVGAVSVDNSLVGASANNGVGTAITALTNGNYLVLSPNWDGMGGQNVGAVTWCPGTAGLIGVVSADNSLVGGSADDQIGVNGTILLLANGNYVVRSPTWDHGSAVDAGAATWGDGTLGVTGVVSVANSLVGGSAHDAIGSGGVALRNGHYVVSSTAWSNGVTGAANAGAVTWGNGTRGVTGAVSAANSLVGSSVDDKVGNTWDGNPVVALASGNYVVGSRYWDNGGLSDVGAVTWGDGTKGVTGVVSTANSLIGSTVGDQVGHVVYALANGHYVLRSPNWNNAGMAYAGAVTWGDGTRCMTGVVSAANSLLGDRPSAYLASDLFPLNNGNYVINTATWSNGVTGADLAGAVTWIDGANVATGVVSAANSMVGSTANDYLGASVVVLGGGDYYIMSRQWDHGAVVDAGAVTLVNGLTGMADAINSGNSVLGGVAGSGTSLLVAYDALRQWMIVGDKVANQVTLMHLPAGADDRLDVPEIRNQPVTGVATNGATFNGYLVTNGLSAATVFVLWGEQDGGGSWTGWTHTNQWSAGAWTSGSYPATNVTLAPNQNYYYTFAVTNAAMRAVASPSKSLITGGVTVQATDNLAQYPGNTGTFVIRRPSSCTNESITVHVALTGSAVSDTDYTPVATQVVLARGQSNATVTIVPKYVATPVATNHAVVLSVVSAWSNSYAVGGASNATVTISNAAHSASSATTIQDGHWTNALVWSGGQVPGAGDVVSVAHAVVLGETIPYAFEILEIAASGSLVFQGTNTAIKAVEVSVSGEITHDAQSDTAAPWVPDHRIWIQCTNLAVLAGGKINAAGKGYAGGVPGGNGKGPGGGLADSVVPYGGGYGGIGGGNFGGSPAYGSATNPAAPGSGAGGAGTDAGGAGGGWVTIEAAGDVRVDGDGLLDANGSAGGGTLSAGGSGGSIYISCNACYGTGVIRAEGGMGTGTGGNGGGGRIAMDVNRAVQPYYVGFVPAFSVARGAIPAGDTSGYPFWARGQGGSLHVGDPSMLPTVLAGGASLSWTPGLTWAPSRLIISNGTCSVALTGATVAVVGDLTLLGAERDTRLNLTNYVTLSCANLLLTNAARLYVYAGVTNTAWPGYTARVIVSGSMEVHTNCVVVPSGASYASHATPDGGPARLEVNNLTIHAGGSVHANGEGYHVPGGGGAGGDTGSVGSGGGYGGRGGDGVDSNSLPATVVAGGATYGAALAPSQPGSGAGRGNNGGGWGGGSVWIRALGTVVNEGTISADGTAGGGSADASCPAGGSGGGVFVVCQSFTGGGVVHANGGAGGGFYNNRIGGNGGGGRVAIWYATLPTDLDAFLARGSTAYRTNVPAGCALSQLSASAGWGGNGGVDGTKSFYRIQPWKTVVILQ